MANQGWTSTAGDGTAWASTDRQSGRCTPTDGAESFIPAASTAQISESGDYGSRSDLHQVAGNLSAS